MTEPTKATGPDGADPSMEEILASIRRILNEDEAATPPAPAEPVPAPAAEAVTDADDDVLVLDRSMLVSTPDEEPPAPSLAMLPQPEPEPEPAAEPVAPQEVAAPPAPPPVPIEPAPRADGGLLAPEAAAAAASSVDGLLRTLAASRSTQVYRGGPTIEDLVREEIRPLLKDWLDSHLPGLVERLVRAEIERVVGRAVS